LAVKIRLRRMGKKKQPIYKVVAADERSPRDGKFIEALGLYNPITNPAIVDIKEERVLYWLGVGAQPTTTVKGLLSQKGILYKRELLKSGLGEEEVNLKIDEWLKQQEAKLSLKAENKAKTKAKKKESVEETKVEETKVEETKVEETKVEESKVEESKPEESNTEEPEVEKPKAEEKKVEETVVESKDKEIVEEAEGAASETKTEEEKAD